MQAAQTGDDAAFGRVVEALAGRLMRFFGQLGVPASDAEDLTQETFIRLYRSRTKYDARFAVTTWAFTIGRRLAIDRWRRRPPEVPLEDAVNVAAPALPDTASPSDLWRVARGALPARQYEALWLCYGEGCSLKEVARIMGVSAVHARVLVHRGRVRLAALLRERKR